MHALPITKSFVAADALARYLATQYALGTVHRQLITATLRDVYRVTTPQQRFIFYLYRAGLRSRKQHAIAASYTDVGAAVTSNQPVYVPMSPHLVTGGGAPRVNRR